jgi:tetratricopeptide (TPR) repeat protein
VKDRLSDEDMRFDTSWRSVSVFLFGIGVETYRYAFMSHKSKRLEALDPMTNHDNPHNNYLYVLASFGVLGLAAYLWLLWRLLSQAFIRFAAKPGGERSAYTRSERAIIFGVVTSFFSYAVYSIAGFDSVACSVFFYFLLGTSAVFFEPAGAEPRARLADAILAHVARLRRREISKGPAPLWLPLAAAVVGVILVGNAVYGGLRVYAAEKAFVGERGRAPSMMAHIDRKITSIKEAIRINPYESFYKQNLGNTYSDGAAQLRKEARDHQQRGQSAAARDRIELAAKYADRAEVALYAALDHAWAPENIFISLFQVYYGDGRRDLAEHALERALEHSPHLGAVRANLAILELERGAWDEAIADCEHVIEVDKRSAAALRTCGRAYYEKDDLARAEAYLTRAKALSKRDPAIDQYLADLEAKKRAKTSTSG